MTRSLRPRLAAALTATALLAGCTPAPGSRETADGARPAPASLPERVAAGRSAAAAPSAPTPTTDPLPPVAGTAGTRNRPATHAGTAPGVLPLVPGVYVMDDAGCAAPPNAAVRFYDGVGISGSATHACRMLVRSQRGSTYTVEQSCIDSPAGDAPRTSEPQTVTVHDAHAFTLVTDDDSARFRHCSPPQLPEYLRTRMAQGN